MKRASAAREFRLDRFITLFFFRPLQRFKPSGRTRLQIPILMYHRITEEPEPCVHPYYRICTSPRRFGEHMNYLKEAGHEVIPLRKAVELVSSPSSALQKGKKFVVLTFDDGYEDFYTHAWPVLRELGYPSTVFLPTAFIGLRTETINKQHQTKAFSSVSNGSARTHPLKLSPLPGCFWKALNRCSDPLANWSSRFPGNTNFFMDWDQIKELHKEGVSFGSHTVNHLKLKDLQDWNLIRAELVGSKIDIERTLGIHVKDFSYPFAFPRADRAFRRRLWKALKDCGYQTCVTTSIGFLSTKDNLFEIKRIPLNDCDDLLLLEAKLQGSYNWMGQVQLIVKNLMAKKNK